MAVQLQILSSHFLPLQRDTRMASIGRVSSMAAAPDSPRPGLVVPLSLGLSSEWREGEAV